MKKLFISQPMNGKTDEEIFREREVAIAEAKKLLGNEEIEVIDSYCHEERNPLGYLAYSIECLSRADVVYFAQGWWKNEKARGCRVEYICATDYGIPTINQDNFDEFE